MLRLFCFSSWFFSVGFVSFRFVSFTKQSHLVTKKTTQKIWNVCYLFPLSARSHWPKSFIVTPLKYSRSIVYLLVKCAFFLLLFCFCSWTTKKTQDNNKIERIDFRCDNSIVVYFSYLISLPSSIQRALWNRVSIFNKRLCHCNMWVLMLISKTFQHSVGEYRPHRTNECSHWSIQRNVVCFWWIFTIFFLFEISIKIAKNSLGNRKTFPVKKNLSKFVDFRPGFPCCRSFLVLFTAISNIFRKIHQTSEAQWRFFPKNLNFGKKNTGEKKRENRSKVVEFCRLFHFFWSFSALCNEKLYFFPKNSSKITTKPQYFSEYANLGNVLPYRSNISVC